MVKNGDGGGSSSLEGLDVGEEVEDARNVLTDVAQQPQSLLNASLSIA
eukprot:CAMPEP_0175790304 /NCGR_PEP_ID=MMETSP0097-20121207/81846_1 /TAXON_ID=311494 /ORGANISM="Alexandrium monilatum, Strain CCMP3105" /LENGTH=47 /DNA_ID= /DNA_START= /DNA_END= /DNA_ORIENTATION=